MCVHILIASCFLPSSTLLVLFRNFLSISAGQNFIMYTSILATALLAASLVSGHGFITSATGNLGGNGTGLGVVSGNPNQLSEVTVFKSSAGAFGETGSVGSLVKSLLFLWAPCKC
jgi:hypothetical protein